MNDFIIYDGLEERIDKGLMMAEVSAYINRNFVPDVPMRAASMKADWWDADDLEHTLELDDSFSEQLEEACKSYSMSLERRRPRFSGYHGEKQADTGGRLDVDAYSDTDVQLDAMAADADVYLDYDAQFDTEMCSYDAMPMPDAMPMASMEYAAPAVRLDTYLQAEEESFHDMLFRLVEESGLSSSEVYNRANMTKQRYSKIKNTPDMIPKKKTIIGFALALKLSLPETDELLMKAGYALSNSSKTDLIYRFFIEKGVYSYFAVNEALMEYGLDKDLIGFN